VGEALFAQHCAACHQANAAGTVGLAPALKGAHWAFLGRDRGYLASVLVYGLSGKIDVDGQTFVGSMPAFGAVLDDASVAALATYLRQLQGASGEPAYAAADVQAVRDLPGSPSVTRQRRVKALVP
jgi:mono/diheme cytochrome c family protein